MARGQSVLETRAGLPLTAVVLIANAVGAAVVLILSAWVLPTGPMADPDGAAVANVAGCARVAATADEVRLGGELRCVAVLFVDLVGSTALAARCPLWARAELELLRDGSS